MTDEDTEAFEAAIRRQEITAMLEWIANWLKQTEHKLSPLERHKDDLKGQDFFRYHELCGLRRGLQSMRNELNTRRNRLKERESALELNI